MERNRIREQIVELFGRTEMIDLLKAFYRDTYGDIDPSEVELLSSAAEKDFNMFSSEIIRVYGKRLPQIMMLAVDDVIDALAWIYGNFSDLRDLSNADAYGWFKMAISGHSAVEQFVRLGGLCNNPRQKELEEKAKKAAFLYQRIHFRIDPVDTILNNLPDIVIDDLEL